MTSENWVDVVKTRSVHVRTAEGSLRPLFVLASRDFSSRTRSDTTKDAEIRSPVNEETSGGKKNTNSDCGN